MKTTVDVDEKLLTRAKESLGIDDTEDLVNAALKALIEREAARRLARMGGSEPDLVAPPRQRFE